MVGTPRPHRSDAGWRAGRFSRHLGVGRGRRSRTLACGAGRFSRTWGVRRGRWSRTWGVRRGAFVADLGHTARALSRLGSHGAGTAVVSRWRGRRRPGRARLQGHFGALCRAPHFDAKTLCSELWSNGLLRRAVEQWPVASGCGATACWVGMWSNGLLRRGVEQWPVASRCGARHRSRKDPRVRQSSRQGHGAGGGDSAGEGATRRGRARLGAGGGDSARA